MLDNPTPPALQVMGVDEIDYDSGGFSARDDTWELIIEACLGRVSDIGAQKLLNTWLDSSGSTSVKAALEADTTLGGAAREIRVVRYRGQQRFTLPNRIEVLLASWLVQVETSG